MSEEKEILGAKNEIYVETARQVEKHQGKDIKRLRTAFVISTSVSRFSLLKESVFFYQID
ncbi:MAG: hypothetical protein AB8B99_09820 [Phormidesmis sp.]